MKLALKKKQAGSNLKSKTMELGDVKYMEDSTNLTLPVKWDK